MTTKRVTVRQFNAIVRHMPADIEHALVRGLRGAAHVLERNVVEQITEMKAVDTNALRGSVHTVPYSDGAKVEVTAPHATIIEEGSRPHMPPVAPLEAWAQRHGMEPGAGWAIAKKIAERGTPPRRYFRAAVGKAVPDMAKEIARELNGAGHGHVTSNAKLEARLRSALKGK